VILDLFFIFSALLIFSSIRVVFSKQTVNAALFLILAFVASSGLFMLMGAELLSIMMILIYVGAVLVLLLFVLMMVDIDAIHVKTVVRQNLATGVFIGLIGLMIFAGIFVQFFAESMVVHNVFKITTAQIAMTLFNEYYLIVVLAGLLLLIGMVAAISMTLRVRKDSKITNVGQQVLATKANRLKIIK
jgi:NADH-quinone oxidoreductase subunit J